MKDNIITQLLEKIRISKLHRARYETQRLQQELDKQIEKNKI